MTHFDDLNTCAFLDLIVGLLDSDTGKRQFLISTCDEKPLRLFDFQLNVVPGELAHLFVAAELADGQECPAL
jgi:hypothetical protein